MKRILLYLLVLAAPCSLHAQFDKLKDSVVQFYGVVMTADSLEGIPSMTIVDKRDGRGTFSSEQGVFSIVVMKGDTIEFTSIGYKPKQVKVPNDLKGNQWSLIQLMVTDTQYLPATIIKPRPTKEQFERDFVKTRVPDDDIEIARQNNDATKRRILARGLPSDAREAANLYLKQAATRYSYQGQQPPQNIFNPLAWADFIKAWKRGDFKNSSN